jgi:hypothetical protein
MKIVVKVEKAGQVVGQTMFDVGKVREPMKQAGKAFKAFRKEHPTVSLLDNDVRLKFETAD